MVIVADLAQPMVVGVGVAPGVAYGQTMNTSYPAQQGSPYGQPQQQGYAQQQQSAAYLAPQQHCAPGATPV
jgi:hypothetical protein